MEDYIVLNNGIKIPRIGYGVYQIPPSSTEHCVSEALKLGYRHIDTAAYYNNEYEVGLAVKNSKIPREEIFITTKIYGADNYDIACKMIDEALEKLQVEHIDLMLIHWPSGDNLAMYKAMEDYYKNKKLRAIGLSNFYGEDLNSILENCEITPTVDQIETHVFRNQYNMQKILKDNGIVLEAWSPLASGENNIFSNEIISSIGNKYSKSNAQVALRYLYQRDILIIPKSTKAERMKDNMNIRNFVLSEEDMNLIDSLDKGKSLFGWY